ncbi:hypothetical protein CDAR_182291 [Caerostris darwini]|uniref:Uncharacterized protein n=1 Tax=Caerostris darwini TaxID=1538125 RepID=A0AAV4U5M4_9ARAC|nr:hypothetical protein CDAR_182291 [Caerostris darwini]
MLITPFFLSVEGWCLRSNFCSPCSVSDASVSREVWIGWRGVEEMTVLPPPPFQVSRVRMFQRLSVSPCYLDREQSESNLQSCKKKKQILQFFIWPQCHCSEVWTN